jgi:hypothetical protein
MGISDANCRALVFNEGKDANTGASRFAGPGPTLELDGYLIFTGLRGVLR